MVDVHEPGVAANHPGQDAHDDPGDDQAGQRDGERQAGGGRRIHPGAEEPATRLVAAEVPSDALGHAEGGIRLRPASDQYEGSDTRGDAHEHDEQQDHATASFG
jgi:hypothetical protein